MYEDKLKRPEGGRVQMKKTFKEGGMDFSGATHSKGLSVRRTIKLSVIEDSQKHSTHCQN